MARHAAGRPDLPRLVLCSPARRALDTLAPLRKALAEDARVRVERPLYLASAAQLLARLRRLPDAERDVLLIGHDPGLHELAVALLRPSRSAAAARLREKLPPGALVAFELDLPGWRALAPGTALLAGFVRPRDLA